MWGEKQNGLFIAVHGDQSNKEDDALAVFAEAAAEKGHQTLSFDLPEHGARKDEHRLCSAQNCVEDLGAVLRYARGVSGNISLFGCSVGAYFGMMSYGGEPLRQALFLSPVVDMARIIENIMAWFNISEERLQREKEIATPVKPLYWEYYAYVRAHPVVWDVPTSILYGKNDDVCEPDAVRDFAQHAGALLTVFEEGGHYFHTDAQLAYLRQWLRANILQANI